MERKRKKADDATEVEEKDGGGGRGIKRLKTDTRRPSN